MPTEQATLAAFDGTDGPSSAEDESASAVDEADLEAVVESVDRLGAVVEQLADRVESPEPADRPVAPEPEHADWGIR